MGWILLLVPPVLFLTWERARGVLFPELTSLGRWIMIGGAIVAITAVWGLFLEAMVRMQGRLERQNRELRALHGAASEVHGDLALPVVLQKVVDGARQLLAARYGALSVIDEGAEIKEFVTAGITERERAAVGPLPRGRGLLGVPLHEGQRIRTARLADDPRSVGFPENHPPMTTLLAVPVQCKSPFRGNLYVSDRTDGKPFDGEDEETLARFATQAAMAIDNAYLHQRLRALAVAEERARIAREMHDGMAQVLAYVNTKAQAVREFLRGGKHEDAAAQLEQIASAAREVYSDVREGIYALRSHPDDTRSLARILADFVSRWSDENGVAVETRFDEDIRLDETAELQLTRIFQEALSNVRKHARASRVSAALWIDGERVIGTVADDGVGLKARERSAEGLPRFGLAIMRERAESVGGLLEIHSEPSGGTRIRFEVPLSSARRRSHPNG